LSESRVFWPETHVTATESSARSAESHVRSIENPVFASAFPGRSRLSPFTPARARVRSIGASESFPV